MDGRTDEILIARPRLHSMQRGKNACPVLWAYVIFGFSNAKIIEIG